MMQQNVNILWIELNCRAYCSVVTEHWASKPKKIQWS